MMKAIATPSGQPTKYVKLTAAEKTARTKEETAWKAEQLANKYLEGRRGAYIAKGWKEPFDLIDDIFARGIDLVKKDRDAIKAQFPKS